jgi:hypothetical protein
MFASYINGSDNVPYYSIYNGMMGWQVAVPIPSPVNAFHNVCLTAGNGSTPIVAAWETLTGNIPYYSTFDGMNWTTVAVPQNGTVMAEYNVNVSFMPNAAIPGPVVTWVTNGANMPFYSTGTVAVAPPMPPPPPPAPSITPPVSIYGNQYKILYPMNREYIDTIVWTASASTSVVSYNVYRNGTLVANVSATSPLQFTDFSISRDQSYQYNVTAVDVNHNESTPVIFNLP